MRSLLKKIALAPVYAVGFIYGLGKSLCGCNSMQDIVDNVTAETEETEETDSWKVVRNIDQDHNRQYYMLPETAACPENMQVLLRGNKEQCEYFINRVSEISSVKQ